MDIFSVGCVIAELFLDGRRLFDLSKLLRYRKKEYDPLSVLDAIDDPFIREMVTSMIDLDPSQRKGADEYLSLYRGTCFPYYFHTFVHQYMHSITDHSNPALLDPDSRFDRINQDFDKIAFFLGFLDQDSIEGSDPALALHKEPRILSPNAETLTHTSNLVDSFSMEISLNIPNFTARIPEGRPVKKADEGALIFVSLICSLVRNLRLPSSKLAAIDCLLAIGIHLQDYYKLERVIPHFISLLSDSVPVVRALSVRALTQLLMTVEEIPPSEAEIFPEYLLPNLQKLTEDPALIVRANYAKCLASLAESGLRFLEYSQMLKHEESDDKREEDESSRMLSLDSFDAHLFRLQDLIQEEVITLLSDPEPIVNRSLLSDISSLCVFFGRERSDLILSHIATILNKHDWQLKCAFFESIISVGTFAGSKSLERYILPLMTDALLDEEEAVVEKILSSLTSLTELGLFQRKTVRQLVQKVAPLLCHPGLSIRYAVIAFISAAANPKNKLFTHFDSQALLLPLLRPFLTRNLSEITETNLLESLQEPLGRPIFNQALVWAKRRANVKESAGSNRSGSGKEDESQRQRSNTFSGKTKDESLVPSFSSQVIANETEDEFLNKQLKKLGIPPDVEKKLLMMKEFIFKTPGSMRSSLLSDSLKNAVNDESPISLKGAAPLRKTVYVQPKQTQMPMMKPSNSNEFGRDSGKSKKGGGQDRSSSLIKNVPNQDEVYGPMSNEEWSAFFGGSASERRGDKSSEARSNRLPISMAPSKSSPSVAMLNNVTAAAVPTGKDFPLNSPSTTSLADAGMFPFSPSIGDQNLIGMSIPQNTLPARTRADSSNPPPGSPTLKSESPPLSNSAEKRKIEFFSAPLTELEPLPQAVKQNRKHRRGQSKDGKELTLLNWRPEGILIGNLIEHRASITHLKISRDNIFFITGSEDGTVKVWDCQRLEKNVSNKSRLTYSPFGGRISALTFVENTYSFVVAAANGSVHICRIECYAKEGALPKYTKCERLQKFDVDDGYVLAMEHYNYGNQSILVFATSMGTIRAIDLKTGLLIWAVEQPLSEGMISAMLVDKDRNYLVTGTQNGCLCCIDLRFGILVKKWHTTKRGPIHQISPFPIARQSHWIIVAGGGFHNEVTIWDLEKALSLKVFGLLEKDVKHWGTGPAPSSESPTDWSAKREENTRAILCPPECPYLITGGTDLKIRFWDLRNPPKSYIITGKSDKEQPVYRLMEQADIQFHTEDLVVSKGEPQQPSKRTPPQAGTSHYDCITCLCVSEVPYFLLITTSRSGVIKVWK